MHLFFIEGIVQGVGFRPYIHTEASKQNLNGFVQNTGKGVNILVDNKEAMQAILKTPPTLARIDTITITESNEKIKGFTIKESQGKGFAEIPADLFICDDCLDELEEKKNRRENYYFTTCTNCGPRFSITTGSPYDRSNTSMKEFTRCASCESEYTNPSDRRYHAQTIACPDCGPELSLHIDGTKIAGKPMQLIKQAVEKLKEGKVVAIKGVGGYHLACTLSAIDKLHALTGRTDKPYALMCNMIEMVDKIAIYTPKEEELLHSAIRPIVLLRAKHKLPCSELSTVGVMLPYTALHYLLFDFIDEPLVLTSANKPNEPISFTKKEQFTNIVLSHAREITNPVDDSLVKVIAGHPLWIRRSRGLVPNSLPLHNQHNENKNILALGAEMNSCFAVTKNNRIILSQYLGTTSNLDAFERYKEVVDFFLTYTKVTPEIILCDMHPGYNTTIYAKELAKRYGAKLQTIQHHKAHAAGVAYEHKLQDSVAIVCDGLGYGEDDTIWGGEVFYNTKRVGHLELHKQLGGDSATKEPKKMLLGILLAFLTPEKAQSFVSFDDATYKLLCTQYKENINTPRTSSAGRILDAAAALLGICDKRTYEGRPALLLEANSFIPYDLEPVIKDNVLLTTPLFKYLIEHLDKNKQRLAATVQFYLARGLYEIAKQYNAQVTFSGGCAYNAIMTEYLLKQGVLMNKEVPPGDGGISYGQVAAYLNKFLEQ